MSGAFRWAPAAAAMAATAGLALVLALVSRGVNRPPTIASLEVEPAVVPPGGSAAVRVTAQDPDDDALRFEYKAESGDIVADAARPGMARYTAPKAARMADRVTVIVHDGRGLQARREGMVTIAAVEATAAPTPAAALTPPSLSPTPPPTPDPEATQPSMRLRKGPPIPPPETPTPHVNRPPVLEPGYPIRGVGHGTTRVMATGHDPDDDPLTHEWDGSGCFEIVHQSATEAEVKFAEGCTGGSMRLTWTDPHGASATAEWPIRK